MMQSSPQTEINTETQALEGLYGDVNPEEPTKYLLHAAIKHQPSQPTNQTLKCFVIYVRFLT